MVSLFLSIYGLLCLIFLPHLNILHFDVPLALILAGGVSRLCILYQNSMQGKILGFV